MFLLGIALLVPGCGSDDPSSPPEPEPPAADDCLDYGALYAETARYSDEGYIGGVAVRGDAVIAASSRGLLSLRRTAAGTLEPADVLEMYALAVRTRGEVAYVAFDVGISVVDVSDRADLKLGESLVFTTNLALLEVGTTHAVAADADRLFVFDLAEPLRPRQVGTLDFSDPGINDLAFVGDHVIVAADDGLRIVSLADPAAPREVGRFEGGQIYSVAAAGSVVALFGPTDRVKLVDVTNPSQPVEASSWEEAAVADGAVALTADRVYLETANGLFVLAHDGGQALVELGFAPHAVGIPRDVVVAGDLVYLASGDLATVVAPVATVPPDPIPISPEEYDHAVLAGDLLFAASGATVTGFDLSTPGAPTIRFAESLPDVVTAIAYEAGSVWMGTATGLLELAVDDSPVALARTVELGARVDALAVRDGLAYVSRSTELVVVDLRLDVPAILGSVGAVWPGDEIEVAGTNAFLHRRGWGFEAFDIATPTSPASVRTHSFVPDPSALAVSATTGVLAVGLVAELRIIDPLAGPGSPVLSTTRLASDIRDLQFRGDELYVSTTHRLEVLEVADGAHPVRVVVWPLRGNRSATTRVLASDTHLVLWTPDGLELLPAHCSTP